MVWVGAWSVTRPRKSGANQAIRRCDKGSFFGDLKAHGWESIDFFTDRKVVISRWF
jgi:hypothetical protein